MALFDKIKKVIDTVGSIAGDENQLPKKSSVLIKDSPDSYADSSSISPDERAYYKPDNYYTYYSYPGTGMGSRVVTFDERKRISFPSNRGLYVAEILLLEYCSKGKYPKPKSGYPGFWWFEYGIRDVGHALESLEMRGFLQLGSVYNGLESLKVDELKSILVKHGLTVTGKKAELVERIKNNISEDEIIIPGYVARYVLTEIGKMELEENAYVPYMHKHNDKTTDNAMFGEVFNVWSINKVLHTSDIKQWKQIVGEIEKKNFGHDIVNMKEEGATKEKVNKSNYLEKRKEVREYLELNKVIIEKKIHTPGDGYEEEMKGIELKKAGKDKEALVQFFISIGKKFDAPALYNHAGIILRRYRMYEEELFVVEEALKNMIKGPQGSPELLERKRKLEELIHQDN